MKYYSLIIKELKEMGMQMQTARFWGLWVLLLIVALGFALPRILNAFILFV